MLEGTFLHRIVWVRSPRPYYSFCWLQTLSQGEEHKDTPHTMRLFLTPKRLKQTVRLEMVQIKSQPNPFRKLETPYSFKWGGGERKKEGRTGFAKRLTVYLCSTKMSTFWLSSLRPDTDPNTYPWHNTNLLWWRSKCERLGNIRIRETTKIQYDRGVPISFSKSGICV